MAGFNQVSSVMTRDQEFVFLGMTLNCVHLLSYGECEIHFHCHFYHIQTDLGTIHESNIYVKKL